MIWNPTTKKFGLETVAMRTNYEVIADENIRRFGTAIDEYGPQLLADRYSDRTHFVYELLQNAEDAIGWRLLVQEDFQRAVAFRLTHEALYFQHSGLPFTEEHVRGICNIGKGTKRQDLTAIGKHGIGFKSVYAYTHHPEVHSGDEHFVIESFVRPRATNARQLADGETLFVLPFDHPDISPETAYDEILDRLHSLGLKTLLFLRNISSIQWEAADGERGEYLRESRQLSDGIEHVTLLGQESEDTDPVEEKWLVLRKEVFHEGQSAGFVEVAFELEANKGNEAQPERITRVNDSPLVVFFPTEKETHLGFLLQGPYRTTPSRDNVPKDDRWNQHLVKESAELIVESLAKLRNAGFLSVSAIAAFIVDPEKYSSGSQAAMFQPISEAIISAIRTQPFIPKFGGGHVAGNQSRLARAENLRQLINAVQLTTLVNSTAQLKWISGEITRERTTVLRNFLVNTIGIEEIDAELLVRRLSKKFLETQTDDWTRSFYEFLLEQQAVRRQLWFPSKPVIRLADNTHVAPARVNGKPTAYLPSRDKTEFPTVKESVCNTDASLKLLKELGLKEPDPVDDVIHNILPRYAKQATEFPPEFNADVERIIEAFQTDSTRRRAELIEHLRSASWIPCRNADTDDIVLAVTDENTYLPTQKLLDLFTGNEDVWFVDRSRLSLQGKKAQMVLEACGAAEYLQRTACECDLSQEDLNEIRRRAGLQRVTSFRISDFSIDGLEKTLDQIAGADAGWESKASQLWDCLQDAIRNYREGFLFGEYRWSYSHESRTERIPANFIRLLRTRAWLPGADGQPKKPSQICFTELPEEFQRDANVTLVTLLEFKPDEIRQLAEKTGIDAAIWDFIREHGLSADELRTRLGIRSPSKSDDPDDSTEDLESDAADDEGDDTKKSETTEGDDDDSKGDVDDQEGDEVGDDDNTDSESTGSGGQPGQGQSGSSGQRRTGSPGGTPGSGSGRSGSAGPRTGEQHGDGADEQGSEKGSRGHTADDREGIINRMLRELEQATSTGVAPTEGEAFSDLKTTRTFQSDARYRDAVLAYERSRGRIPQPKSDTEEGHDIDSFVREKGSLGRKLARRIEVKGKGVPWSSAEIVELSDRQFADAATRRVEEGIPVASDFDYWLYVVEDDGAGTLTVLPIRNPARRAAHFEFRAGTWRHLAEVEPPLSSDTSAPIE